MVNSCPNLLFHAFVQAPFLYNFWVHFGLHFGVILGAKFATILLLGRCWRSIGRLFRHLVFIFLFYDFWVRPGVGVRGCMRLVGATSPGMFLFLTFCSKSELTPCVFEVFWISGFPVPVRERLPKGNLPLSEVPPSEYLTECRRIPEEFRRGSPEELKDR